MEAVLAARIGDEIGAHGGGWGELLLNLTGGIIAGVIVGAIMVAAVGAVVASGGVAAPLIVGLMYAAAYAGGVSAGLGVVASLMNLSSRRHGSNQPPCSKVD